MPDVLTDVPLVERRRWNATPLAALTSIIAFFDPASSVSRIITPAFVQSPTCCTDATPATGPPRAPRGLPVRRPFRAPPPPPPPGAPPDPTYPMSCDNQVLPTCA